MKLPDNAWKRVGRNVLYVGENEITYTLPQQLHCVAALGLWLLCRPIILYR